MPPEEISREGGIRDKDAAQNVGNGIQIILGIFVERHIGKPLDQSKNAIINKHRDDNHHYVAQTENNNFSPGMLLRQTKREAPDNKEAGTYCQIRLVNAERDHKQDTCKYHLPEILLPCEAPGSRYRQQQ